VPGQLSTVTQPFATLGPLAQLWGVGVLCLGASLASGQEQPSAQLRPPAPVPQQIPSPRTCGLRAPDHCLVILGKDQAGIWTSPLRIKKQDLTWLVPVVAATSVAFVFDKQTLEAIGTSNPQRTNAFREVSNVTGIYIPLATIGTSIIAGAAKHDRHLEESGWLAGEAMLDAMIVSTTLKYASNRDRPNQTDHNGEFWSGETGGHPSGLSFPSGHTMAAWAFARVAWMEGQTGRLQPGRHCAILTCHGPGALSLRYVGGKRYGISHRRLCLQPQLRARNLFHAADQPPLHWLRHADPLMHADG
jgi:hypothetical protein